MARVCIEEKKSSSSSSSSSSKKSSSSSSSSKSYPLLRSLEMMIVNTRSATTVAASTPPKTGVVIPRIVVSPFSLSDFGSGQPSSYPSAPFGCSGQLSSKSFTPSWSVSRSLLEQPSSLTFVDGESGHLSPRFAPSMYSPGQSASRLWFHSGLPQLSP